MRDIEKIRKRARSARDDSYYNKLYALTRWFSGDDAMMLGGPQVRSVSGTGAFSASYSDLPEFPFIDIPLGLPGIMNHGLVNSRINIQSIVYSDPEIVFSCDDPIKREINSGFIKRRWEQGDWGSVFLEVGMEVEATGMGIVEIGMRDGKVSVEARSVLDTLWDRGHRSRGQWRFVFFRNRVDVDEAFEKYGGLVSEEELENLAREVVMSSFVGTMEAAQLGELRQIREWSYWDKECHCIFLGSIGAGDSIVLRLVDDGTGSFVYERVDDVETGMAGPNPFGVIPAAIWTDCWSPGVLRPVGKTETTWRVARILNQLEAHMVNTCERSIALTLLSTAGMDKEQISRITHANGPDDIALIIPMDQGDIHNAIHRVPAGGIGDGVMQAIQYYKEQINASTGVADTQRGQPLPGDKTAEEVRTLSVSQGVQNKHLRRQYASFLKEIIGKVRMIGSKYDKYPTIIPVGENQVDTSQIDIAPFLAEELEVQIRENSLAYESEEDKTMKRLQMFQAVDVPAIQMGVADPVKVVKDVYKDTGVIDPTSRMYTPEQMAAMQQAMSAQAGSGQQPGGPEGSKQPASKEKPGERTNQAE